MRTCVRAPVALLARAHGLENGRDGSTSRRYIVCKKLCVLVDRLPSHPSTIHPIPSIPCLHPSSSAWHTARRVDGQTGRQAPPIVVGWMGWIPACAPVVTRWQIACLRRPGGRRENRLPGPQDALDTRWDHSRQGADESTARNNWLWCLSIRVRRQDAMPWGASELSILYQGQQEPTSRALAISVFWLFLYPWPWPLAALYHLGLHGTDLLVPTFYT